MKKIGNVFYIQRAAIDVLLLNEASALEICTYLVISRFTDRHGHYSVVGYKTLKERLGVGQRKIDEAITRLRNMQFSDQRLLYSLSEWIHKETGIQDQEKYKVGWVRGWFDSEYEHHVWLSNDLVGCNGDSSSPLKYFITKNNIHDNHIRLLLLMYKYCNRQYAGVNYKFASIMTICDPDSKYKINNIHFQKSSLDKYHISNNILNKFNIAASNKETSAILDNLQKYGFLDVSVSVIGNHDGPDIRAGKRRKFSDKTKKNPDGEIKKRDMSVKQRIAYQKHLQWLNDYNELKKNLIDPRESFELGINHSTKPGENVFSIKLKKVLKTGPMAELKQNVFDALADYPGLFPTTYTKFVYRLDYKSTKKQSLNRDDCLALKIEKIAAKRNGLEPASRKGKFYKSYWWFHPEIDDIALVGILMPLYTPYNNLTIYDKAKAALKNMRISKSFAIEKIDDLYEDRG
jgi:hypothetical protein